ncbi:MAG: hypothetical protein ABJB11_04500 [Ferruginibacter sp.]
MKIIFYFFSIIFLLYGCAVNRDYLSRADEDKTMFDVIKRLNKKSDDEDATKAITEVYSKVVNKHLQKIDVYKTYNDIGKWDKLIAEYNTLQDIFNAVDNSDAASRFVKPISYQNELQQVQQNAAEDYYQLGNTYLDKNNRSDARSAYMAYKKAGSLVKDYKDTRELMDEAYNNSVVTVVINPIIDNSFFYNAGWGNMGYNYSNDYFQQKLVTDLGGKYATRYPARFYTDRELSWENLQPDWVVDLTLRNMDIPRPSISSYKRNVSQQIKVSTDTAGKPVYQTVYATLIIQRQYFNARAQMDINIVEVETRKNIAYNSYSNTYNWQDEVATYSGDRRALSSSDLALVNNSNYNMPRREEILNQLYQSIYPQIRNSIISAAQW